MSSVKPLRTAFVAVLVFGLWVAAPAGAQDPDFTIIVPVEIHALHPTLTEGRVGCYISRFDPPSAAAYATIAMGETTFRLTDGSYTGDVTVTLEATGAWSPSEGRTYQCTLFLKLPRGDAFWDASQMSAEGSVYFFEEARLTPGAPSRFWVRGRLSP